MSAPSRGEDYYELLGVEPNATPEQIRQAYRHNVRLTHPDLRGAGADSAPFRRIKRAYEVLADPAARARYDVTMVFVGNAEAARFYRRSFNRLFFNLFSGLQAVLDSSAHPSEDVNEQGRKAG